MRFLVSEQSNWRYSNTDPGNPGWTTSIPSGWGQYAPGNFPQSTSTRYYANLLTLTSVYQGMPLLEVDVFTHEGFILYLNGVEYNRFNLPSGSISHATPCTQALENGVWKRIRLPALQMLSSSTLMVAVEVHGTGSSSTADDFKARVVPIAEGEMDRTVDLTVNSTVAPANQGDLDKIVDGLSSNYLLLTSTGNSTVSLTFTFNNDRREWFNRYMIQSSPSNAAADPREWSLSASNDGVSWTLLDYRDNEVFSARRQRRTFDIRGQMGIWNQVRLDIIARLDNDVDRLQMGDLFLLTVGSLQNEAVTLAYEGVKDVYYVGADSSIDLMPVYAGYSNFNIAPELPTGLSLNSNNGHLYGSLQESMVNVTTYTITATRMATNAQETVTVQLAIAACDLTTQSLVELRKHNVAGSDMDTFSINTMLPETVLQSFTGSDGVSTDVHRVCLTQGDFLLVLGSKMNFAWKSGSYVEVYVFNTLTESIRVGSATLRDAPSQSFPIHGRMEMHNSQTTFYVYNSTDPLPSDWKTAAPTNWPTFDPFRSSSIVLNESVWFIRGQVYIDGTHVTSYLRSYFLDIYCRAGMVVYLNGNEIYRVNVAETGEMDRSSTIMGGSQNPGWRRIVGLHTVWNTGINSLAIVLVNAPSAAQLPMDARIRLYLSQSSELMPHTFGIEPLYSGQRVGYPASNLFDNDYSTYSMMERSSSSSAVQYWGVHFTDGSAVLANKYCFVNTGDAERWDPVEWEVRVSNDNDINAPEAQYLKTVSWNARQQRACFTLKDVAKPYRFYYFLLKRNSNQFPDDYYALAEIELYTVTSTSIVETALTYNPQVVTGYFGYSITTMQPTLEGFYNCSSNPSLPNGLSIESDSGVISGIPLSEQAMASYQITCHNSVGTVVSTSVTITITACSLPSRVFSVMFPEVGEMGSNIRYELKSGTSTTDSRESLLNYHSHILTVCGAGGSLYQLSLQSNDAYGLHDRYALIRLADERELFRISATSNTPTESVQFSPFYVVDETTTWRYSYGQEPNLNWQANNGTESWATEEPGQFPATDSIAQYYTATFQVSNPTSYTGVELQIRIQAGAAVYLNGQVIFLANLPVSTPRNTTLAESQYAIAQTRMNSVANENLLQETNVLAVEIHRGSSVPSINTFTAKLLLLTSNQPRIQDGVASSNREGTEGHEISAAFDQNPNTFFNYEGMCVGTTLQWSFNRASQHYINSYTVVYHNCAHMMPSAWRIEGSREGETWTLLDVQTNQVWSDDAKSKTFSFYNGNNYAVFRMVITQCQSVAEVDASCPAIGVRIADLIFQVATVDYGTVCPSNGEFPPALNQGYSYTSCDSNYSGYRRRYCSNGALGSVESYCTVSAPTSFSYPQESYELVVDQPISPEIAPSIVCADCTFTIDPALPSGMELNSVSGVFSGTPLNITANTRYTVTARNAGGFQTVLLNILTTNETVHCYMDLLNGWESTLVNETAVQECPSASGYSGNMTRLCLPGSPAQWAPAINNCEVVIPNITLANTTYNFVKNEQITPIIPVVSGYDIISRTISPRLPAGLYFDPNTAAISGKPTEKIASTEFTITIRNANGEAHATLTITVTALTCAAQDGWSETDSGDTAYRACASDKEGEWYRVCQSANPPTWGTAVDNCQYIKPVVTYPSSLLTLQRNQQTTITPTTQFYISAWSIAGSLPVGLSFNQANGVISGTPTEVTELVTVTISASNPDKVTQVTLSIAVDIYTCPAEGVWPETEAGQSVTRDCDNVALKEGSLSRTCVSSGYSVSWGEIVDTCKFKAPILQYPVNTIVARRGEAIETVTPTTGNQIDSITISPSLPEGLAFHSSSGAISGTPTGEASSTSHVITAQNTDSSTQATLQVTILVVTCPQDGQWPMTERGNRAYIWCEGGAVGVQTRQCGEESDEDPVWRTVDTSACVANPSEERPSEGQAFVRFTLRLESVTTFDAVTYAAVRRVLAEGLTSSGVTENAIVLESHSQGTFSVLATGTVLQVRIRVADENAETMQQAMVNFASTTLTSRLRGSNVATLATATGSVDESSFVITRYTMVNSLVSSLLIIVIVMAVVLVLIGVFYFLHRTQASRKKSGHDRLASSNRAGTRHRSLNEETRHKKHRHYEDDEEEERPRKSKSKHYEDDEEERPRKSKSKHYEEEEERPRKKSKKSRHYDDSD